MLNATGPRLAAIFRAVLELPQGAEVSALRQATTPGWDSLAHVVLVGAIESEFNMSIDAADSLDLTSYEAVRLFLDARGL